MPNFAKYKYYKNKDENDYLVQGIVDEIIIKNQEFPLKDGTCGSRFKNVFSCTTIPESNDERFKTCISWQRQTIEKDDLIAFKGYFIKGGFIVKGLSILKKANNNLEYGKSN